MAVQEEFPEFLDLALYCALRAGLETASYRVFRLTQCRIDSVLSRMHAGGHAMDTDLRRAPEEQKWQQPEIRMH